MVDMGITRMSAAAALLPLAIASCPGPVRAAQKGPCSQGRSHESKTLDAGIVLHEESCTDPEYHAFVVEMDLDAPGWDFVVTPYKSRRRTTSSFAGKFDAFVATNGGFWGGEWGGFTVSSGELWPKKAEDFDSSTVVGFGSRDASGRLRVEIRPTEEMLTEPLPWMRHALTGIPLLLDQGEAVETENEHTLFVHKHPRTALGLSKDGGTVWIAVIDGRQKGWSRGLRTSQVGQLLRSYGAWSALNLDGGSSSTLVVPSLGGLVNDPCYKKADERAVPNHLGIVRVKKKKKGPLARLLAPLHALVDLVRAVQAHGV
jgi:hypothetical protein